MKVLMTGGGTAGHINPALAIADTIRAHHPDAKFLFVGAPQGMEARLVPAAGYEFVSMPVAGFQRKLNLTNIRRNLEAVGHLLRSGGRAARILRDFQPDVAIGTGGYVSGPILRKAAQMGIPVLVHEANAFPGVTVKMLAHHCECVMVAVEDAKKRLPDHVRIAVTGNPVRTEVLAYDRDRVRASSCGWLPSGSICEAMRFFVSFSRIFRACSRSMCPASAFFQESVVTKSR